MFEPLALLIVASITALESSCGESPLNAATSITNGSPTGNGGCSISLNSRGLSTSTPATSFDAGPTPCKVQLPGTGELIWTITADGVSCISTLSISGAARIPLGENTATSTDSCCRTNTVEKLSVWGAISRVTTAAELSCISTSIAVVRSRFNCQ